MNMVVKFKAPASRRLIALNSSIDDIAIIEPISLEEMHQAIDEYEERRIREYWDEYLLVQVPGSKTVRAFVGTTNELNGAEYLQTRYLRRILNSDLRGRPLLKIAEKLTIKRQRHLLENSIPKTRLELSKTVRRCKGILDIDFHYELRKAKSIEAFIERLTYGLITDHGRRKEVWPYRNFELLVFLWSKGWILFPHNLKTWNNNNKWSLLTNPIYAGERANLIKSIYVPPEKIGHADKSFTFCCTWCAASDINSTKDISVEIVDAFETIALDILEKQYTPTEKDQKYKKSDMGRVRTAALAFLQIFNLENPELAQSLKRKQRDNPWNNRGRLDGTYSWLAAERPDLSSWAETFHLFIQLRTSARVASPMDRLNTFADYICTLDNPPLNPWEIVRRTHIYDATLTNTNTYYEYCRKNLANAKRSNGNFTTIRHYFAWLRDYLVGIGKSNLSEFSEPIWLTDTFGKVYNPPKTHRNSLPPYIMNEMKAVLIGNDFEFPKTCNKALPLVRNQETGESLRIFDPGMAICLYTLLEEPIRSHQARWLDSGELDEFIYDPGKHKYVKNPSQFAIPKRKEGAFRLHEDKLRAESTLSLWVNTNKTALYDGPNTGYEIPWVSPTLRGLLHTQLLWQKQYLPELREPLVYRIYQGDVREHNRPNILEGPSVCPLFRDPGRTDQRLPYDYSRLARFYTKILEETQHRIEKKYGQKLTLVNPGKKGETKWVVDLHSLRVSGVTNLIEAGVPLEVVQQFVVGHQVLVTTLHYLKYSPAKLREFIQIAHDRMNSDLDFTGSEMFARSLEELSPFLIGNSGIGVGAGVDALRLKDGLMTINPDGICPGTSCSTGGSLEIKSTNKYGPVPGGQRCGLCRYWLTGPAHILGQVAAVNNLAYDIRKKGQEIAKLNELRLIAEDNNDQKGARRHRDRVDLLNRELEIDANEWASRYSLAEQSLVLLDEYISAKNTIIATDKKIPVPILTKSDEIELKITLEQSHEFALLDQITQMSEFTTGFTNKKAEIEKNYLLSKMMVANGIRPFLLTLGEQQAHEAGNLLSALLLQQVEHSSITDLLDGARPLQSYPNLANAIALLEKEAASGSLAKAGGVQRISEIVDGVSRQQIRDIDEPRESHSDDTQ